MMTSTLAWKEENKTSGDGKISVKEVNFSDFAANASIHGLRNTVDPGTGKTRRILWILLLIGFAVYLAITISYRIQKYQSYPVSSKMQMVEVESLTLPAMTVCNMNYIREPYVRNDTFLKNVLLALSPETKHASKVDLADPKVYDKLDSEYNLRQIYREGGYNLSNVIYECVWNTATVDCSDYFTTILTPLGHCFTFHSSEVLAKSKPLVATQTGVDQGFTISVNISQYEYFFQPRNSAGIRLLVHDPCDWPLVDSLGMAISPGTETFLSVRKLMVKKLPPPYGGNTCIDKDDPSFENPLKYYDVYTKSTCSQECFLDYLITNCGCVPHTVEMRNSTLEDCNFFRYGVCVAAYEHKYKTNSEHLKRCNCRDTCVKTSYQVTRSEAYFPSERRSHEIAEKYNVTNDGNFGTIMRQNYLVVNLYISEMSYNLYEEKAAYTIGDLQSDVGGNLGLCLGASFLSLAELTEFLLVRLIRLAGNISKVKTPNRSSPPG